MAVVGWILVALVLWIIIREAHAAFTKGDGHPNRPPPQHSAEHARSTQAEPEELQLELAFAPPLVEQRADDAVLRYLLRCEAQHDIEAADEVDIVDVLTEWCQWRYITAATAAKCMTPEERNALKRHPDWRWDNDRQFWLNVAQGADALVTQPKPRSTHSEERVGTPRDWLRL